MRKKLQRQLKKCVFSDATLIEIESSKAMIEYLTIHCEMIKSKIYEIQRSKDRRSEDGGELERKSHQGTKHLPKVAQGHDEATDGQSACRYLARSDP